MIFILVCIESIISSIISDFKKRRVIWKYVDNFKLLTIWSPRREMPWSEREERWIYWESVRLMRGRRRQCGLCVSSSYRRHSTACEPSTTNCNSTYTPLLFLSKLNCCKVTLYWSSLSVLLLTITVSYIIMFKGFWFQ